jgi:hypothetical protein
MSKTAKSMSTRIVIAIEHQVATGSEMPGRSQDVLTLALLFALRRTYPSSRHVLAALLGMLLTKRQPAPVPRAP